MDYVEKPTRRNEATFAFLRKYQCILFAVVLTTLITRQFTTFSTLYSACDNYGNGGNRNIESEPFLSEKLDRPRPNNSKAKTTTTKIETEKPPKVAQYSFETIPSRTWKPFEHKFPCYPPSQNDHNIMKMTPCHTGILFQRPTKVGSTTMTNIVLRLAYNRGSIEANKEKTISSRKLKETKKTKSTQKLKQTKKTKSTATATSTANQDAWHNPPWCQHRTMHQSSVKLDYTHRDKEKSFLFSLVRDPTKRELSEYFHFFVTYKREEPTDINFITHAIKPQNSNRLIRDLTFDETLPRKMDAEFEWFMVDWNKKHGSGTSTETTRNNIDHLLKNETILEPLNYTQIVGEILDNYDFIAVTERMDESLVAFKILLGLSVEEVLYAKASRSAGSFSNSEPAETRPCMYLIPSFLTDGMRDFFYTPHKNDRWIEYSRGDALLNHAASESLDRTIDEVFGRERFERELTEFRNALAYAQAICMSEPDLVLGLCDEAGRSVSNDPNRTTTCYIWSEGCDHKCLNERVPNPIPRAVLEGTQTFGQ